MCNSLRMAVTFVLRLATPDDIEDMHRVRLAVTENTLSSPNRITREDYLAAIDRVGRTWVIEIAGVVIAFASGLFSGNVWALFVDPKFEKLGYGKSLHRVMIDWLWSQGLARLWLTTGAGTRAEQFYLSQGWRPCEHNQEDDLCFELFAST